MKPDAIPPTEGKIVYETSFAGPPGDGEKLQLATLRHNTATRRTVYFDGKNARVEETNADYGLRSPCVRLWLAGQAGSLYCKELPRLKFCVDFPAAEVPGGHEPPEVQPLDGTVTVAGRQCRRAQYNDGGRRLTVAYAPDLAIADPTGAVERLEGIAGLPLQWEETPRSPRDTIVKRVTVVELALSAVDPSLFAVPAGYRKLAGIDAARAEDRRLLDAEAAAEEQQRPLSAAERNSFLGRWRWEGDGATVEVTHSGSDEPWSNDYRFRSVDAFGTREERAVMKGRLLLVEEPPNYRLYRLTDEGRHLVLVGDDAFRYARATP